MYWLLHDAMEIRYNYGYLPPRRIKDKLLFLLASTAVCPRTGLSPALARHLQDQVRALLPPLTGKGVTPSLDKQMN